MSSAICLNLDQSKILSSGNGLNAEKTCPKQFYFSYKVVKNPLSLKHGIFSIGWNHSILTDNEYIYTLQRKKCYINMRMSETCGWFGHCVP